MKHVYRNFWSDEKFNVANNIDKPHIKWVILPSRPLKWWFQRMNTSIWASKVENLNFERTRWLRQTLKRIQLGRRGRLRAYMIINKPHHSMLLIINLGNWLFSDGNIFYSHRKNDRKLEQFELEHVVDFQMFFKIWWLKARDCRFQMTSREDTPLFEFEYFLEHIPDSF